MTEPDLAVPGKGLPLLERLFIKHVYMPRLQEKNSWEESDKKFHLETIRILERVEPLSHEQRTIRILIPHIRGMEDSSRYWSVNLTLEHLMVVTKAMSDIIIQLSLGRDFPHEVLIQNVKPIGILKEDSPAVFRVSMESAEDYLAKQINNRNSPTTHPHPWFGHMTAHGWHTLLAAHHAIHREQIEKIIAGLPV